MSEGLTRTFRFDTTLRIPTYPSRWRRWLWYATRGRLAFPVWEEWTLEDCEQAARLSGASFDFKVGSVRRGEDGI
jgi:hypothetical protein